MKVHVQDRDDRQLMQHSIQPIFSISSRTYLYSEFLTACLVVSHNRTFARSCRLEPIGTNLTRGKRDRQAWGSMPTTRLTYRRYISLLQTQQQKPTLLLDRKADGKRGDQALVIVDTRRHLELSLPILRAEDEMGFYDVDDPYHKDYGYHRGHYLFPREVTPDEITGFASRNNPSQNENWYDDLILPAASAREIHYQFRRAGRRDGHSLLLHL